jgi:GNAT superfamily N-acetyltransferase
MQIQEVDPGDQATCAAAAHLQTEATAVDCPWMTPGAGADEPKRLLVGIEQGTVVARGCFDVDSRDDPDIAWIDVVVHPLCRREGRGSMMAAAVTELAELMGRRILRTTAWADTPGTRFVRGRGFRHVGTTVHRRRHEPDLDPRHVDELHDGAAAIASDYELVRTADAHDLAGVRRYRLEAVHRDGGGPAARTTVTVDPGRPTTAVQGETGVLPEHRGNRLGLWLRSSALLWLREVEPQVTYVDTVHEESDHFTAALNDVLAYRVLGRELVYER